MVIYGLCMISENGCEIACITVIYSAPPISPRRGLVLGAWFEFRGRGLGLGGVVKLVTVWLDESG